VIAVELDQRLIEPLHGAVRGLGNVAIVQGDILELDLAVLVAAPSEHYVVVANLPYYITSAVLRHLLESSLRPKRIVVTVQREVAERIVAKPGQMSLLALSVQYYGTPRLLFRVKPGSFYPSPEVESAVLRIDLYEEALVAGDDPRGFFRVARAGFAQRRKQLRNSLAGGLGMAPSAAEALLAKAGVDARRRAQSLTLEEWGRITQAYAEAGAGPPGSRTGVDDGG
jgi:16S rRNA (adenine1518-N6/adenine1519-N6)-dimethyltransferase